MVNMYDTVNFWIDRAIAGGNPFAIANYLSDISESYNTKYGYSINGNIDNYKITINEGGISLKGSLAKYLLDCNIQTLTRAGTKQAIEKLSDTIHTPIHEAKVGRIDISTVFNVKHSPASYYRHFGNKPYFTRLQTTKDTLYYDTQKKQLVFYDKIKESKSKGVIIPELYTGENLLRYELRFTKRICEQFKVQELTGATLTNEQFYLNLVKTWANEYQSINKLKAISPMDTKNIKTPSDAKNIFFGSLLHDKDISYIDNFINDLKSNNTYPDPKYYTRLKGELLSLFQASTNTEQSELIQELNKEVSNVMQYCR